MEICSRIELSPDKIKDLHSLSMNTSESTHGVLNVLSVDELSADVTKFMKIQDATEEDLSPSPPHQSCECQEKDIFGKSHFSQTMTPAPEKCLSTFSKSAKILSSPQDAISNELLIHGDNIKSLDPSGFRSIPMTTHMKPVSAMKGSREKRGITPPEKLTVKWAPDVYDPIPTSVSHVATNNHRSSRHSKKNSKNKQKSGSKSSKGSKGKDKKQVRKRGGHSSGMGYKVLDYEEEMVDFREHEPRSTGINFHVGNPDQLCGSSFLKRYGTSLHLSSVAEAT